MVGLQDPVKVTCQGLTADVGRTIYDSGKARICTLLEAVLEGQKLNAAKRILEDILSDIAINVTEHIKYTVGEDWSRTLD